MSVVQKFESMEYGAAPEDPREALAWLDGHKRRFGHFINGAWREPVAGGFFETTDPSNGEKLADVAQGSAQDVHAAVAAARGPLRSTHVPPKAAVSPRSTSAVLKVV